MHFTDNEISQLLGITINEIIMIRNEHIKRTSEQNQPCPINDNSQLGEPSCPANYLHWYVSEQTIEHFKALYLHKITSLLYIYNFKVDDLDTPAFAYIYIETLKSHSLAKAVYSRVGSAVTQKQAREVKHSIEEMDCMIGSLEEELAGLLD